MSVDKDMFVTWGDDIESKQQAFGSITDKVHEYGMIAARDHTQGSTIFQNAGPNTSVRDGISRRDWEFFRPEEAVPRQLRAALVACTQAYYRMGIIRNVVDLMAEFTCQGIRWVHKNPNIQKLYREWAKKVNFHERSERFCNQLFRTSNVVVQRGKAVLQEGDLDRLRRGIASRQLTQISPPPDFKKNEIPINYTFINPLILDVMGGEDLATFTGVAIYGLRIPTTVFNKIKNPKTDEERYLVNSLPKYIISAVNQDKKIIQLDPSQTRTFFYKKDDWEIWARPMLYGIIDDLILFNKMRLADLSALDGAISHIRLWKLGSLEHHIAPKPAMIQKLANVLMNNTATGAIDLIWGPELDFKETSTDVHHFLGSDKYGQVIQNIYDGLGIPTPQQSQGGGKGGMDSFLSLKVMIERLKYARSVLNAFWEQEGTIFQQSLGLRTPAQLQYDYMVLTDENAYLNLCVSLVDRDLMSATTLQEIFGRIPEVEEALIRKEHSQREKGKRKSKSGPYHNPEVEDDMLKLFIQQGVVTPSQVGLELDDKAPGEKSALQLKLDAAKQKLAQAPFGGGGNNKDSQQKGLPGQGRPVNTVDKGPRKQRNQTKPVKGAADFLSIRAWAKEVQGVISEVITPLYLQSVNKDTARKLTQEEFVELENFKFAVLCNLFPFATFNKEVFEQLMGNELPIPDIAIELMDTTIAKCKEKLHRDLTIDEQRLLMVDIYSLIMVDV